MNTVKRSNPAPKLLIVTLMALASAVTAEVAIADTACAESSEGHRQIPPDPSSPVGQAAAACATENGLPTPGDGVKPTVEQREVFHECMQTKLAALGIKPRQPAADSKADSQTD